MNKEFEKGVFKIMKKLIINADDFGYCKGVNYGIVEACKEGILTSTTMMANMPGFVHAIGLHEQNPSLGIGVHLVLTTGRPVLRNLKTITDAEGNFRKQAYYKGAFIVDELEIYNEWKAQIEKILEAGIIPTHLDSHHHANVFGNFNTIFLKLADEYNLPVRNNFTNSDMKRRTTDAFVYTMETVIKTTKDLDNLFEFNNSVEIMCHPAFLDKFLLSNTSYTYPRTDELELLTHPKTIELFKQHPEIQLTTFNNI